MNALLSLIGLYNYDTSILDGLTEQLPVGVDSDTLKNSILAETAELEVIYPDPSVMKTMIGVWAKAMNRVWQKMYNTTTLEYNPIENYDRAEEWTDSGTGKRTNETSGTGKITDEGTYNGKTVIDNDVSTSGTDTGKTTGSSSDNSSNLHNVTGFNSDTATLDNSDVYSGNGSTETNTSATTSGTTAQDQTTTTTDSNGNTRTTEDSGTDTENTENSSTHTGRIHGNIGVTTSQTMIKQEREIAEFNFIDYVVDGFKQRFCLMVY